MEEIKHTLENFLSNQKSKEKGNDQIISQSVKSA